MSQAKSLFLGFLFDAVSGRASVALMIVVLVTGAILFGLAAVVLWSTRRWMENVDYHKWQQRESIQPKPRLEPRPELLRQTMDHVPSASPGGRRSNLHEMLQRLRSPAS
jgi:uncharacterized membrane protein YedE/YeeE